MTENPDIQKELAEILNAPAIPVSALQPKGSGSAGRCHWCGQMSANLVEVEPGRYKGIECCGQRHA